MIDQKMRALVYGTAALAMMQASVVGAEALPPRALARIGDHRLYHGPGVGCAALSPDGKRIASAADQANIDSHLVSAEEVKEYQRVIVVWDAVSGERLRELRVPEQPVLGLAFSGEGKYLAAAHVSRDRTWAVTVFVVETGKILRRFEPFKNEIDYLQFSPDDKQLLLSEAYGPVSAWDVASGKRLKQWNPPPEESAGKDQPKQRARNGLLSPDGKVIAWEMGYHDPLRGAGAWTATGLRVHQAATDQLLYRKTTEREPIRGRLVFSANSKRLATYRQGRLLVWDTASGKERKSISIPHVYSFVLTPDGRTTVIYPEAPNCEEHEFCLERWDMDKGERLTPWEVDYMNTWEREPLPRLQAFSSDGKTLLLATSPRLRVFDVTTGKQRFPARFVTPVTVRLSGDGRRLFTCNPTRRWRWDVAGEVPALRSQQQRQAWDFGFAYSADDRLLLDASERPIRLRETATGRVLCKLEGTDVPTFNPPEGRFAADASRALLWDNPPEKVRIYDLKTGKSSATLAAEGAKGEPVISGDGRLVAWASEDDSVRLYDAVKGKIVRTLRSAKPLADSEIDHAQLLFTPDGERLIVTTYKAFTTPLAQQSTRVFQVGSGREILHFHANPEKRSKAGELSCRVCSPDGRLLAVAEKHGGTVRLLELASGQVRAEFAGHRHGVRSLSFAADGRTLASGGEDHVVFLWDVTGAKTLPTKMELTEAWNDLASADGKRAGLAIAALLHKPQASVAFLREKLRPITALDEKGLAQLLANLDGDDFDKREAASRELIDLGERVEEALRRALANRPSLEMRRRIEDILSKLEPAPPTSETLRILRAIEVLEHSGTAEARRCLEVLAKGAAEARQTREAKAALQRLANRR